MPFNINGTQKIHAEVIVCLPFRENVEVKEKNAEKCLILKYFQGIAFRSMPARKNGNFPIVSRQFRSIWNHEEGKLA